MKDTAKSGEERLARRFVLEFGPRVLSDKAPYFKQRGFTYETVRNPEVLFSFLAILSYDMRPYFNYKDAWGPDDFPKSQSNSVMEAFDREGVSLEFVEDANEADLRSKLRGQRVHGLSLEQIARVDHAKGLRELAQHVRKMTQLLRTLDEPNHLTELRQMIDDIHGFGETLTAKAIMFLVRCFGVGLTYVDPRELETIAHALLGELYVDKRAKILIQHGLDPSRLIRELANLGDPFAIELLYELETDNDLETILQDEGL